MKFQFLRESQKPRATEEFYFLGGRLPGGLYREVFHTPCVSEQSFTEFSDHGYFSNDYDFGRVALRTRATTHFSAQTGKQKKHSIKCHNFCDCFLGVGNKSGKIGAKYLEPALKNMTHKCGHHLGKQTTVYYFKSRRTSL